MEEFGKNLKTLRKERNLTMDMLVFDLNEKYDLGIHKSNISRWESGETDPALSYAVKIADYFDVSLDYMIGLTNLRTPARLRAYAKGIRQLNKEKDDKK